MRTSRFPVSALAGLLSVTLLGPVTAAAQEATPAPAFGELNVVERREVRIEGAWPLALAPDGHWLAVWRAAEGDEGNAICAYDAATLAEHLCAPMTARSVDPGTVVWSPDGTRLAFTERLTLGDEPDLWVFDVAAGSVTNLTDDGVESLFRANDGAVGDVAPAWSPDGTELAFARSIREETALYRISAAGGEVERIVAIGPDEGYAVWAGVHWTDGSHVLVSVVPSNRREQAGIWAIDVSGGETRRVVAPDPAVGPPILVAISARGRALLYYPLFMAVSDPSAPSFALADLATGSVEPITPEGSVTSEDAAYRRVTAAAFSPDGERLLLVYRGLESQSLAVRDLATGKEQALPLPSQEWPLATHSTGGGVTWAANDLVFFVGPARLGVLLRLAAA